MYKSLTEICRFAGWLILPVSFMFLASAKEASVPDVHLGFVAAFYVIMALIFFLKFLKWYALK